MRIFLKEKKVKIIKSTLRDLKRIKLIEFMDL